jgi:hypothetical protein
MKMANEESSSRKKIAARAVLAVGALVGKHSVQESSPRLSRSNAKFSACQNSLKTNLDPLNATPAENFFMVVEEGVSTPYGKMQALSRFVSQDYETERTKQEDITEKLQ